MTAAVLSIAGAVGGSVGLALYHVDMPSTEAARVTPVITPGGGGAVIWGRF